MVREAYGAGAGNIKSGFANGAGAGTMRCRCCQGGIPGQDRRERMVIQADREPI
jgi:hypothetical protein